jgi:hypothetical protein
VRTCKRVDNGLPPGPVGCCKRCDGERHLLVIRDPATCYRHGTRMPVFAEDLTITLDSDETVFNAQPFGWDDDHL